MPKETAAEKRERERAEKAEAARLEKQVAEQEAAKGEEVLDGVFIVAQEDQNGALVPKIVLNGNTKVTEVEYILKAALRDFNKEMGFQ